MQLLIPNEVLRKIRYHMILAGRREIGGMVMGEEVGDQKFRIVDFSVDTKSGTRSSFVRDSDQHEQALKEFFEKSGKDYRRFNYLGEWHTHPCFSVHPSLQDIDAMQELVDGSEGVSFAVLLIARLRWYWRFECSAHLFVRGHAPTPVDITHDINWKQK